MRPFSPALRNRNNTHQCVATFTTKVPNSCTNLASTWPHAKSFLLRAAVRRPAQKISYKRESMHFPRSTKLRQLALLTSLPRTIGTVTLSTRTQTLEEFQESSQGYPTAVFLRRLKCHDVGKPSVIGKENTNAMNVVAQPPVTESS